MRILMVAPLAPAAQATNAVPLVSQACLAGLAPCHEVTLATIVRPDTDAHDALLRWQAAGVDVRTVLAALPSGANRWRRRWRLVSMWLRGQYPFRTVWFWEPGFQRLLDRLFLEKPFDLVVITDNAAGVYRYRTAAPTLLTEGEVRRPRPVAWQRWAAGNPLAWVFGEVDWRRWRGYQRAVWSRFDRILVFTVHDATAARMLAPKLAERVRVLPFGVELPALPECAEEKANTLVFVGGFSHPPNVDAALWLGQEIMPRLRARHPGLHLIIVGSEPPDVVRALVAADIEVTGYVAAVDPYLARAAVVLAPVRTGGGQRLKVLQGMALAKSVVTTPLGAEGIVSLSGPPPLIIASDTEGIVDATLLLLNNTERRQDLGKRARTFVAEHYSPVAYAQRLESVYAELQAEHTTL